MFIYMVLNHMSLYHSGKEIKTCNDELFPLPLSKHITSSKKVEETHSPKTKFKPRKRE